MNKIGFIGLGNMGFFMSKNLTEHGFLVDGFDLSENALEKMKKHDKWKHETWKKCFFWQLNTWKIETCFFHKNGHF